PEHLIHDSHDADACYIRAPARQLGSEPIRLALDKPAISLNRRTEKALAGWIRGCRFGRCETSELKSTDFEGTIRLLLDAIYPRRRRFRRAGKTRTDSRKHRRDRV